MFSLSRLSSVELSVKLDVFLGRKGPPYQIRRGLFLFHHLFVTLFLLICNCVLVHFGGPFLMISFVFGIISSSIDSGLTFHRIGHGFWYHF